MVSFLTNIQDRKPVAKIYIKSPLPCKYLEQALYQISTFVEFEVIVGINTVSQMVTFGGVSSQVDVKIMIYLCVT